MDENSALPTTKTFKKMLNKNAIKSEKNQIRAGSAATRPPPFENPGYVPASPVLNSIGDYGLVDPYKVQTLPTETTYRAGIAVHLSGVISI